MAAKLISAPQNAVLDSAKTTTMIGNVFIFLFLAGTTLCNIILIWPSLSKLVKKIIKINLAEAQIVNIKIPLPNVIRQPTLFCRRCSL
jgi:hypothetical protein